MRRFVYLGLALFLVAGCKPDVTNIRIDNGNKNNGGTNGNSGGSAASVTLSVHSVNIDKCATPQYGAQLAWTATPSNALLTFVSRNTSVATVNSTGFIQAVGVGETYVVVSTNTSPAATDSVKVTVECGGQASNKTLSITPRDGTHQVGTTAVFTAKCYQGGVEVPCGTVTWSTTDLSRLSFTTGNPTTVTFLAVTPTIPVKLCGKAADTNEDCINLTIVAAPTNAYVIEPQNATTFLQTSSGVCAGVPVAYTLKQNGQVVQGTWSVNGGGTFTGSTFTPTTAGSYTVSATYQGSVVTTTSVTVQNNCSTPFQILGAGNISTCSGAFGSLQMSTSPATVVTWTVDTNNLQISSNGAVTVVVAGSSGTAQVKAVASNGTQQTVTITYGCQTSSQCVWTTSTGLYQVAAGAQVQLSMTPGGPCGNVPPYWYDDKPSIGLVTGFPYVYRIQDRSGLIIDYPAGWSGYFKGVAPGQTTVTAQTSITNTTPLYSHLMTVASASSSSMPVSPFNLSLTETQALNQDYMVLPNRAPSQGSKLVRVLTWDEWKLEHEKQ